MIFRCAKNDKGVIIATGSDEGQAGNYPINSTEESRLGVWCEWTMEDSPAVELVEGMEPGALLFKENEEGNGIELRSDEEVLADPFGDAEPEEVPEEE